MHILAASVMLPSVLLSLGFLGLMIASHTGGR